MRDKDKLETVPRLTTQYLSFKSKCHWSYNLILLHYFTFSPLDLGLGTQTQGIDNNEYGPTLFYQTFREWTFLIKRSKPSLLFVQSMSINQRSPFDTHLKVDITLANMNLRDISFQQKFQLQL